MVRIPRTSTRASQRFYSKLLTRVDPSARTGFGFEGTIVRPGSTVPWSALWPTPEHPRIPILLEYAGTADATPERGHRRRRQPDIYVLWRFDPEAKTWSELGRSASLSWTWALELRPLAIRALEESRGKAVEVFSGLEKVLERIRHVLDQQIQQLPPPDRFRAVAAMHDEFFVRFARFVPVDGSQAGSESGRLPG